ncbi:MAG: ATP-binding protein [Candidatus Polarisedimenticolia bacterium]
MTFRLNLKLKVTLTICCLLALSVISLGWIFLLQVEDTALRSLRDKGGIVARSLADAAEFGVLTHNAEQLDAVLAPLRERSDVVYAAVADETDSILAQHRAPGLGEVPEWRTGTASGTGSGEGSGPAVTGPGPQGDPSPVYYLTAPIRAGRASPMGGDFDLLTGPVPPRGEATPDGGRIGTSCIGISSAGVLSEMRGLRRGLVLATLAVLIAGVVIAVFLVRLIVDPINELAHATERIAAGDLDLLLPRRGRDEIGALAESFNQMTLKLRDSRRALEESNLELERKVHDRTRALKEAQKQLIQAEKMTVVGQLVSGVAHELNNPLAGVLGYAQLLVRKGADGDIRRGLLKIEAEAERCKRIVQNLLIFARKHKPQKTPVNLNAVIEQTLEMRDYHLRTDNIAVVRDLDPALPTTMADTNQIQQVLMNMVNNAQHAMLDVDRPRQLAVRTRHLDGRLVIQISDNGSGIAPENLPRIFDPFFTTKEVGRGTGLGLSICYGIVQEHRGSIQVESAAGRGTTFTLELPVQHEASPAATPESVIQEAIGAAARRGRILLVDDEASILEIIRDVLRLDGHDVQAETNGTAALQRLGREHFDVVVTDLKMPGMSGQELYHRLSANDPSLVRRLVFTTGDLASPETLVFLERTGNPYLQKPFDLNAVRRIVQAVLAKTAGETAAAS